MIVDTDISRYGVLEKIILIIILLNYFFQNGFAFIGEDRAYSQIIQLDIERVIATVEEINLEHLLIEIVEIFSEVEEV